MTNQYYQAQSAFLREVLQDAIDRGDYHLEMDTREALESLTERFLEEEQP